MLQQVRFHPFVSLYFTIVLTFGLHSLCLSSELVGGLNNPHNLSSTYRYGSIKVNESNIRKGPGIEYEVIATIKGRNVPVMIKGNIENWTFIQNQDGLEGWIRKNFVSTYTRFAIAISRARVCRLPVKRLSQCQTIALLKKDSVVKLLRCNRRWCRIQIRKELTGWVKKELIWGIDKDEFI